MKERYLGAILGLAIGDAVGYPAEFLKLPGIIRKYGPKGVQDFKPAGHHPPGTYSDDTQMSLAIARALISVGENPGLDRNNIEDVMSMVIREFIHWYQSPENNRAPGNTCMAGCGRLAQGVSWQESGVPHSKGCGSAMRSAPIGLFYHNDLEKMREVAIASSLATHGHSCALAGSFATAYLVSIALNGIRPESMIDMLCQATESISTEFTEKMGQVPKTLPLESEEAFRILGEGWVADEAVACALYCFLRCPNDFRETVLTGANSNGDSDSIACIAGAISGAYNGIEAIPEKWARGVENSVMLQDIAIRLYQLASSS